MTTRVREGGVFSTSGRLLVVYAILLSIPACHGGPPKIVPPPPTSIRVVELQRSINAVLADPALEHATWGIVVKSLSGDETLYALNQRRMLMPASAMKIVTLAAAAERLGWDYRFQTRLFAVGSVDAGVLDGDLVIVGSGDPSLDDWAGGATLVFNRWAALLKEQGIRTIAGRLVGDDNAFDDRGLGVGWAWDDLGASYATSVGALQFNENTARIIVGPGPAEGEPASITTEPEAAQLTLRNQVNTVAPGAPALLQIRLLPLTSTIELRGVVPIGAQPLARNASVPNPTLYFANALRLALVRNGIDVGPAVDIDDLTDAPDATKGRLISQEFSASLAQLATTMMKLSQNLYAETLLKTVAAKAQGIGSSEEGRSAVRTTLEGWRIPVSEMLMVDGSGLSRYNLITPDALVGILAHVYRDERLRDPFIETLPTAGVDGTLANRMKETPAAGNAHAKTGSFSNARAIAGYVRSANDEPLVFSILANNYGVEPDVIERASDAIVTALARFSR